MPRKGVSDHARLKHRLASRRAKPCAVRWCQETTGGLSNFCTRHRDRKKATGDPEGKTLLRSLVRRHADSARAYLLTHREHPAVEAGLSWAYRWIRTGKAYGWTARGLEPAQQARLYLQRLEEAGIHEADALGVIVALVFLREYERGVVASDDHFRHQLIVHLLGLAPWPSEERYGRPRKRYFRPSPGAVSVLWRQIPPPVLVLAHRIATKLHEAEAGPSVNVDALLQPLPDNKVTE